MFEHYKLLLAQHEEQNKLFMAQHVSEQNNMQQELLGKFAKATEKQFAVVDSRLANLEADATACKTGNVEVQKTLGGSSAPLLLISSFYLSLDPNLLPIPAGSWQS